MIGSGKASSNTPVHNRPIRILHVMDKLGIRGASIHGVTQALAWWINHFDQTSFEFNLISLRAEDQAAEVMRQNGISVMFLGRSKFDPRTLTDLIAIIRRENPDILHLHGFGSSNFGRIASKLTGVPNIVHEHSVFDDQPFYQTIADTLLAPFTDQAISISADVSDYMIRSRKIPVRKLETVFLGVPLENFKPQSLAQLQEKRQQLGIPPNVRVISTVGRLDTQKGQIYLLRAAVEVITAFPDVCFMIVGDGPDQEMLQNFANEAKIADKVIFTGFRRDVADLLALSDIVCIPSLWEGGPITVFEAMHIGKPIVATPVGMMGQVIDDGQNGYLVPIESVEPLAARLIDLLKDPEKAREMGEKARTVSADFDIHRSVNELGDIYRRMVQSG